MNDADLTGFIWMFGLIALCGVVCLLLGAYQIWRGRTTRDWREVQGVIMENKTVSNEHLPHVHGVARTPAYAFSVRYEYVVDGVTFKGRRIHYGMRNMSKKEELQAYLAEFSVGAEVAVFVDPQTPRVSVLVPGISSASVGLFIFGLVVTMIGGVVYFFIKR